MCGFAGEFVFAGPADSAVANAMAEMLNHRGPDKSTCYMSNDGQCAIAFRRLSVVDLEYSDQPMTDHSGRYTLAFNGEIYNFQTLRAELEQAGVHFRTTGDTEVLLQLLMRDGVDCLSKLRGMFAAVLYDNTEKKLIFLRDRMGEKPLFYAALHDRIIFASELKALKKHPKVDGRFNASFITSFISICYIHSPATPFDSIKKLPPSHWAEISSNNVRPRLFRYYSAGGPVADLPDNPARRAKFVRDKIISTVGERLIADVPLGLLLSGGIDSAVVLAAMCEHMPAHSIKTFTAGFNDATYDERAEAAQLAKEFGTDHHELNISPSPQGMLDWAVDTYDEPFADSSAWPTYHICRAAREHITVALVGDGGDEVFGGYDRYRAMHISQHLKPFQYFALRGAGVVANLVAPHREKNLLRRFARFARTLQYPPAVQYFNFRRLFGPEDLLNLFTPEFMEAHDVYVDGPAEWFCNLFEQGRSDQQAVNAQYHDIATYLPDDLLVKTDRASMAASLELRSPLLDHDLVEIGLALPAEEKWNNRYGKLILQRAFRNVIPNEVFMRRKKGFAVPLASWLRNELREELRQALTDKAFRDLRIFNHNAVADLANEHVSGRADFSHQLWALMVLSKWLVKNS